MSLLTPTSIAVVGASSEPGKVGHEIFKNLQTQGFKGKLFPVNVKRPEILGVKAYPSVKDLPETPDLVVVVTPATTVAGVLEECGSKGVKTVIVISAGFGEIGTDEGRAKEHELANIAKKHGITLVGPNCLGVLRPAISMNASFAKEVPPKGGIALLSQSGALAVAILDQACALGMGYSLVVSMGNKASLDECDFLQMCAADDETKVIGLYLESIMDGRRFIAEANKLRGKKRIVLIKSGTTAHGKKAVSSHTGALAGSDAAITAACEAAGVLRAETMEEFLGLLRVLSMQPPLLSPRVAVITNAGGPGILATDEAEKRGLDLSALTEKRGSELKPKLPAAASVHNPIDVLGDALADRYTAALEAACSDEGIDGLCVLLTPQIMTPPKEIAEAIIAAKKKRPLMPIVTSFVGSDTVGDAIAKLHAASIPSFSTPEGAVRMLAALLDHSFDSYSFIDSKNEHRKTDAQKILQGVSGLLSEDKTEELFTLYGLPLPKQELATSAEQAALMAEKIGFPVIMKISSPEILHKTDVGGVRANLANREAVIKAFAEIIANSKKHMPKANIKGVLVQQFLPVGNEFIVGSVRDSSFGPTILVGLGGIYTELFRDSTLRIAPVNERTAYEMLESLKSWKLLLGLRGKAQSDIDALAQVIVKVSELVTECPQITELDLNPVLVSEKGVVVADAKVILS
jgi:acetyltransferase